MNKKYLYIITFFLSIAMVVNVFASISGRSGSTGSPTESTCTSCHSSYALNAGGGSIAITHNIPTSGYVPGSTYAISVTVAQTGFSLFGFGFEALTSSNTSAGTIMVTNTTTMKLSTAGNGRVNITHKTNGGSGTSPVAFSFNWTAPATNLGTITFFAAGDACNNNGNEFGDYVYSTSLAIAPSNNNTITTGNISSSTFCAGQTGIAIPFNITGTYTSGNVFTAQLSSSTGSFTTPTNIGTLTSVSGGTITSNVGLPSVAGSLYGIRVVASTPSTTGSANTSNLTINIQPTTANAGSDQVICGTSTTLAANSPTVGVGKWTRLSGTGSFADSTLSNTTITGLGAGPNQFLWTISNGSCTSSADTVVITGALSPTTANAGSDQTACATTTALNGNTPTTGTGIWTKVNGNGTFINPANPTTTVTGLSAGINIFIWIITNSPCASSSDTVVITQAGSITTANAGSDQQLCSVTSTTLAANTPSVGTGVWSKVSGSCTFSNSWNPTTTVSGLGWGQNILLWTISNPPCTPSADTVVISVLSSPTMAYAGIDQVVCLNTVTLNGNSPSSGTGTWSLLSGTGTFTNSSLANTTVSGLGIGSNQFIWKISSGSCGISADTVLISYPGSITTSNAGPPQTICATTTTLSGNTPTTGTGLWSVISGTGSISSPANANTAVTGLGNGDIVFRWTISNPPCTSSSSDVTIHNCNSNVIATGSITGSPFCSNTSFATSVPYVSIGSFSGYYTAELSDSLGSFSSPVRIGIGTTSPISVNIPSNTPSGTKYRIRVKNSSPATMGADNGVDLSINTCIPNSITTGTIQGSPFCQNTTFTVYVPFSFVGNYTGSFYAQLSDASGSFTTPIIIGSGTNSPITCTILAATASGTGYRIRIMCNSPYMLGNDNGSDLEINSCYAIITDSIKGSPFCSSTSYSVSIPFHTVGNVTGPFIAELSNVSGNFDTPLTIGYSTNSPIATSIPQGTPYGNNYRIRVRNSASGLPLYQNTTNLYINTCVNTGLDDLAHGKKPTLYPNPNNGKFYVTIGNEIQEEMNLSIYNALGMQVYQKTVDQNSQDGLIPIDLNQAAAGIYFISIENKGKTTMLKFSVE